MQANNPRFQAALRRFDEENRRDPTMEKDGEVAAPREWLYARRLSEWVLRLSPGASEVLQLAARCQHLCRWEIPRDTYEKSRVGYLKWREALKRLHAQKSAEILREVGYPEDLIQKVQALNLKRNFPRDPEGRVLEDALCLVFLQYQFADLTRKTGPDKMIGVLRKTWKKMTEEGRRQALGLSYREQEKRLLDQALQVG